MTPTAFETGNYKFLMNFRVFLSADFVELRAKRFFFLRFLKNVHILHQRKSIKKRKMGKQKSFKQNIICDEFQGCNQLVLPDKTMPFQLRLQTRRRIPRHCHPDHLLR